MSKDFYIDKKRNIIIIDEKEEPHKYNIFAQLAQDGKAIINNTDTDCRWWRDESRTIGRMVSDIKVGGERAIMPPSSNVYNRIGYVITNKRAIIKEDPKGKFTIGLK